MTLYPRNKQRESHSKQTALFKDDIDDVGEDFWITPSEVMKRLKEEFKFDFDACPYPRPAGVDNLREEWGRSTWVNPPIGKGHSLSAWVNKAVEERKKGKTVVMILPFARWMRPLLEVGAEFRFDGPIHFLSPQGRRNKSEGGGRVPDIFVIMKPEPTASKVASEQEGA